MFIVWLGIAFIIGHFILQNWKKFVTFVKLHKRATECLKDVAGLPTLPLIGNVHCFKLDPEEFTEQMDKWGRDFLIDHPSQSGVAVAWIGPVPIVFLGMAEAVKPILESTTLIDKPAQYDALSQWIGEGLLTSTNKKWFTRRRMLTPTFHFNRLDGYYEIFARQSEIFANSIAKFADSEVEFDLYPYVKRCALDIICEAVMGTNINSQIGENSEYVDAVIKLSHIVWDHERFPWLWFKPIWYLSGVGFKFNKLVELTNDFTRDVIRKRRQTLIEEDLLVKLQSKSVEDMKKHNITFIDILLGLQASNGLSDEDVREEIDTFMFEGHDTTSSGVGFTVWWLGQYPECQERVHKELDEVFGDSDRLCDTEDLRRLIYLEKCVKEAQRLTPSVPMIARQLNHDVNISGHTIPEGMTVVITPLACHRDKRNWEKPEEFFPEHFDLDAISKRDPYAYIPFSAGPRNCIGQKFAIQEEKSVLSTILRKYRFVTTEPFPGNRAIPEVILKPSNGFRMRMYKR